MASLKKYEIQISETKSEIVECCEHQISSDGKRVEFWIPAGSFMVRDGRIDAGGYWTLVAAYQMENIISFRLVSEKRIE